MCVCVCVCVCERERERERERANEQAQTDHIALNTAHTEEKIRSVMATR